MTKSNGDSWRFYRTWQFPVALLVRLFFYYCSLITPRQDPLKRKITQNLLAEIEAALDEYKIDQGLYPIPPAIPKIGQKIGSQTGVIEKLKAELFNRISSIFGQIRAEEK